jgi:hypothetical protein
MTIKKNTDIGFRRNNLDKSSSPYLLQHAANPVWWQEWSEELIKYAVSQEKLLFVSVGYSSCHWCHVMASEAFSDHETADYLNENFISVKVDREQRPDIDQYLMDFINAQNGRGGWPLNVFMTPELSPVYALTYAPVQTRDSMLSLKTISEKVNEYFEQNRDKIPPFIAAENQPGIANESDLAQSLSKYYDPDYGGFGSGQKFPPHSSLLFLLYQIALEDSPSIKTICKKTLYMMSMRGLNDHLQGGIFRYCVDREWTIPHFEKMLYDQAMALWSYSLAYRLMGIETYKKMAVNILKCLDDCFSIEGLYLTGHDADTEHKEGATYLWSFEELEKELLPEEFDRFSKAYFIDRKGNFEGMTHLLRRNDDDLDDIEKKLLSFRQTRKQPARDDKILCGINALVVISLLQAGRYLGRSELENKAAAIMKNILDRFWNGKVLKHSWYNGVYQDQNYLFDAAAVLLAVTMLYENDDSWEGLMKDMTVYVGSFKDGSGWRESMVEDFQLIYASWLDHPIPSTVSLAESGLTRAALLTGGELPLKQYREPFKSDFYNIVVMMNNGLFHVIESEREIPWSLLPVNSIRIRGKHETDCFMGACRPLEDGFSSV